MSDFDAIRPYHDDEVAAILVRLVNDREFLNSIIRLKFGKTVSLFSFALRGLVKVRLTKEIQHIHSIADFQAEIENYLVKSLSTTTSRVTVSGLENLDNNEAYLFISNHRDIAMDPALVNLMIYRNGFSTLRIAIGDNLLTKPFASDLMRLNKSFIVNRSATAPREKLKAARLLSSYIHHSVLKDKENVWIAQREGRAKDGLDRTNTAIISMLAMSKPKAQSLSEYMQEARVVPVSISYEYDPCDADKARELYSVQEHGGYQKDEHEDVQSIAQGITGYKGHVHLAFGKTLQDDYEDTSTVTQELDRQILLNYHLHPSNCIAFEILEGHAPEVEINGKLFGEQEFTEERKQFKLRLDAIDALHREIFLSAYANPVKDKLSLAGE